MIRRLTTIFFIAFTCAAFQFPTAGEYEHVTDFRGKVQESEVENSWTENPTRKASENKRPWDNESFLDMEGYVSPGFDDWAMPEFADFNPWDVAPAPLYGTDDIFLPIWHMAGCGFSKLIKITDCYTEHRFNFRYIHGVVVEWGITGPVSYGQIVIGAMPSYILFHPLPNATEGSEICVFAHTRSLKGGEIDGECHTCTKVYCEECECGGTEPDINWNGDPEIAAGGTKNLWVDSLGDACPPYTWQVSGTGYSLNTYTTENDLETVTLSCAAGT